MSTRSQRWSKVAHERVVAAAQNSDAGGRAKYRTSCNKMPGLIHQAGLLQAVVFQTARDEHGRRFINDLCAARGLKRTDTSYQELIRELQQAPSLAYMALTEEISEISVWFRRFASIEISEESDNE